MNIKSITHLLSATLFCGAMHAQTPVCIELPLTMHRGYSQFPVAYAGLSTHSLNADNQSENTFVFAKGIPDSWTEVGQGSIETNTYQTLYQNYHLGKISADYYANLQQSWNWTPDPEQLSIKPIKTTIIFATGTDVSGNKKVIVDANNNLDFSDDTIYSPYDVALLSRDNRGLDNCIEVYYESYEQGAIVQKKTTLMIVWNEHAKMFMFNFPHYATTSLNGHTIHLSSANFINLSWDRTNMMLMTHDEATAPVTSPSVVISKDEYLAVDGMLYKNKGVNLGKQVLVLEEVTDPVDQLYSTQAGFRAPLFEGEDVITKKKITLDDYKGKYLLIDFWSTWCGPCIQEIPNLRALYGKTDRLRFEIISIVGDSSASDLMTSIEKHEIVWPQILSDSENNITKNYRVNGYPTTFLVNPEGIIIEKDLRGGELDEKVEELLNP